MSDDWFIRYPKIRHIGHKDTAGLFDNTVYITEKVDGANFRFGVYNGVLKFGSRNVSISDLPELQWPKRFASAIDIVRNLEDKLPDGYIFFAEYMIPHTIQYDWDKIPHLLGFDVYGVNEKRFLDWDDVVSMFDEIGIPTVPLLGIYEPGELTVDEVEKLIPKSAFYDGVAEGIVIKNYNDQIFGKVVSKKFKEFHKSPSLRKGNDDTERIFAEFFTENRIRKIMQKLIDEQNMDVDMRMMRPLIYGVIEDVVAEHGVEIFSRYSYVDLRRLRKMLSRYLQNYLRREMLTNAILEGDRDV